MKHAPAYNITVAKLAAAGSNHIPVEVSSSGHLVYSSPATLSYNSPGAEGFGVKRAALVIPESIMLLVSPDCCGRTDILSVDNRTNSSSDYRNRTYYLKITENDLISGRHVTIIPEAVMEIYDSCIIKPKVILICITCVDALLGTDIDTVCRAAQNLCSNVRVIPCRMYALTREGSNPPMAAVRQTVYSLLEKREKKSDTVNILGFFSPLEKNSDLKVLLSQAGFPKIYEISRCGTIEDYLDMGSAWFNLILDPEAGKVAADLERRLGIPYAELRRLYELDKIRNQYRLFGKALGITFDDTEFVKSAEKAVDRLVTLCKGMTFAIGKVLNANSFELALSLLKYGLNVSAVFCEPFPSDYTFIKRMAALSPETCVYPPLSPTMLNFNENQVQADITIGRDMPFYLPHAKNVSWSSEIQPFGYTALIHLVDEIEKVVTDNSTEQTVFEKKSESRTA